MDEIFGKDNFVNEIIWFYPDSPGRSNAYFPKNMILFFFYSKSKKKYVFNADLIRVENFGKTPIYKTPRKLGGREYVGGGICRNW